MSFSMECLGETMRVERARRRWTQQDLADRVGVNKYTVKNWELGESAPSLQHASKMCDLFCISLDELAGRDLERA